MFSLDFLSIVCIHSVVQSTGPVPLVVLFLPFHSSVLSTDFVTCNFSVPADYAGQPQGYFREFSDF